MLLEVIEKMLASFLILALLVIIMFLAFPDQVGVSRGGGGRTVVSENTEKDTPLPKADAKQPSKIVARRPDSSGNDAPMYISRRKTPPPTPARAPRKMVRYDTRPHVLAEDRYYDYGDARERYYEQRYSDRYDDCNGRSCACDCNRPYWASASTSCWSY